MFLGEMLEGIELNPANQLFPAVQEWQELEEGHRIHPSLSCTDEGSICHRKWP